MKRKIDKEACVPIPHEMAEALGLDEGSELDVRVSGRHIVITRAENEDEPFIGWGTPDVQFAAAVAKFANDDLPGLTASVDEGIAEMELGFVEGLRQGLAAHPVVLARLERVIAAAMETFRDLKVSRAWVLRPHPWLEWRSPIATAMTEEGALVVEGVLGQILSGRTV
ncbi:antitoxin Xre/MbcA/ParS toxin-binding domain-containing protein [Pararoseomonas sp. SCSIO 73927]|uniref:antitoxin Xre/MbcA/ParS toxin-binding domain-containing protein n=1 Tax=Pararoseomonas sp. SCSIO 73927 TaxID=3114537 RepID=UPI0030CDAB80